MEKLTLTYEVLIILTAVLICVLLFLGVLFLIKLIIKYILEHRENRLLNSYEYLPEEEIQTLKQVFYLIIITITFLDIIYSIIFWNSTEYGTYFLYFDLITSLIACLVMKKDRLFDKLIILTLIPIPIFFHNVITNGVLQFTHIDLMNPIIIVLLLIHLLGFAYVIKVYYGKFITFTESNGLGISILLLFGLIFISFIFTSFVEDVDFLDSLSMVSNAFTSNGYAVLGNTPLGKLNSLFLVWGGYILSGVGTATLTVAIMSRHFNKRFEELESLIRENNQTNEEKEEK